jgi:hypothetical protein
MENKKFENIAVASFVVAIAIMTTGSFLVPKPAASENSTRISDCWFVYADSGINYKVQSWNLTQEGGHGTCDYLKGLCYDMQINYYYNNSATNCRWLAASDMYGNRSCVCSRTTIEGVVNVTR